MRDITVIGITGSIGMGKSTAAEMLRDMGIPIHDSDATVHWLLGSKGQAVAAVGKKFPEALLKNEAGESYIDRKILGRIVFADHKQKKVLEEILHPMVWAESAAFITEMQKNGHDMAALDIPLLFETGGEKRVDVTLCASAPEDLQRQRVLERPGMTSEKFDRIVAGQLPDAEKCKRADYVIKTDQSFDSMKRELGLIIDQIRAAREKGGGICNL